MKKLKKPKFPDLPKKFPACFTVGELRKALADLPADLPIESGGSEGVKPVAFNVFYDNCHLALEENDGTWDDEAELEDDDAEAA
jgi:hypothetical protein